MVEYCNPRINGTQLANYVGQTVTLTCEVLKQPAANTGVASVRVSCGTVITAKFFDPSSLSRYVSLKAEVKDSGLVHVRTCTNLGEKFDLHLAEQVLHYTTQPAMEGIFFGGESTKHER